MKNLWKGDIKKIMFFCLSKARYIKSFKSCQISFRWNCIKNVRQNHVIFLIIKSTLVHINVVFLPIETTSKKVWQNKKSTSQKRQFFSIVITLQKMLQNGVDFWPIGTTLKRYVKIRWKLVDIFSSTCRHNTNIELTLIRRAMFLGLCDSMTSP